MQEFRKTMPKNVSVEHLLTRKTGADIRITFLIRWYSVQDIIVHMEKQNPKLAA